MDEVKTMRPYTRCSEATQACMRTGRFAVAHLKSDERARGMHIHDCLELYYSISGDKQFVVGERLYDAHPGDLFVLNPYEAHRPVMREDAAHERIVVCIHPDYPASLSTHSTDLTSCFFERPDGFSHRVSLTRAQRAAFESLLDRCAAPEGFGSDLLENTSFTELLVMVSGLYLDEPSEEAAGPAIDCADARVRAILSYIDERNAQPVTLEEIGGAFYISQGYLCRIFKEATGTTLGRYILARRIGRAKRLLAQGMSVHETCEACGFGDYTHFIRAFGQAVGMSPKQYALRRREA
jgi:AraC-like DNA-binding protein/mannose-6-phosphate isomerase-like protein (cupin superfamily)